MQIQPDISSAQSIAAALDWWRDAGVDWDYSDDVQNWLAEAEAPQAAPAPKVATKPADAPAREPAITASGLPGNLAAFRAWWTDLASPLPAGSAPRIAPRGEAGASLMLLVPMPEEQDRETLLSGPQGTMLANLCRALGIAPDAAYFASALPGHMPLPDWDDLRAEGLGHALARHIELAKPQRLLVLGGKLPAMLGLDPDAPPESLRQVAGIPALAAFAPDRLLDHPRQRARLWHRLLEWTAQ